MIKMISPDSGNTFSSVRLFFILCLMLVCTGLMAGGTPGRTEPADGPASGVKGRILDVKDSLPIEYASVVLYDAASREIVTGAITDTKGRFSLQGLADGDYILEASFIGYMTHSERISISGKSVTLDAPILLSGSIGLASSRITAERDERKTTAEKTSINVSRNIASVRGSLLDVLRTQPGITTDSRGNLQIRGNANILVLIDGIPTTVTDLQSIQPADIAKIDVITSPDASHDAEGTGGIISLSTRRNALRGVSGQAGVNYGLKGRANGSLNISVRQDKWGADVSYAGRYEKETVTSTLEREIYSRGSLTRQSVMATPISSTHSVTAGGFYRPTSMDRISISLKGNFPKTVTLQDISGSENLLRTDGTGGTQQDTRQFTRYNDITFARKVAEGSISYEHTFRENGRISASAGFSSTDGDRPASYTIDGILSQKSDGGGKPQNRFFQTDYSKTFRNGTKFDTGLKLFFRSNYFRYDFYELSPSGVWEASTRFSNDLRHRENVYSAYAMVSGKIARKFPYKAGARLEFSHSSLVQNTTGETVSRRYLHPFPYVSVGFPLPEAHRLTFTVNSRISRPTYPQLNPVINIIDHTIFEYGNKELDPEVSGKAELFYSFSSERLKLTSGIYATQTWDQITQATTLADESSLMVTYANIDRAYRGGGYAGLTLKVCRWLTLSPSLSGYYSRTFGEFMGADLGSCGFSWNGALNLSVKPLKGMTLSCSAVYNSPEVLPQFRVDRIFFTDISLRQTLLKDRMTLSVSVSDLFNTDRWNLVSDTPQYSLVNISKTDSRVFWFGISYSFNSFSVKNAGKKKEKPSGLIRLGQ